MSGEYHSPPVLRFLGWRRRCEGRGSSIKLSAGRKLKTKNYHSPPVLKAPDVEKRGED